MPVANQYNACREHPVRDVYRIRREENKRKRCRLARSFTFPLSLSRDLALYRYHKREKDNLRHIDELAMNFDGFLATVNGWGRYQKTKFLFVCLTYMVPPIMVYAWSFTAATPDFRCRQPDPATDAYTDLFNDKFKAFYQPSEEQCKREQTRLSLKECQRCYRQSSDNRSATSLELQACETYVFDRSIYKRTLVEEVSCSSFRVPSELATDISSGRWSVIEYRIDSPFKWSTSSGSCVERSSSAWWRTSRRKPRVVALDFHYRTLELDTAVDRSWVSVSFWWPSLVCSAPLDRSLNSDSGLRTWSMSSLDFSSPFRPEGFPSPALSLAPKWVSLAPLHSSFALRCSWATQTSDGRHHHGLLLYPGGISSGLLGVLHSHLATVNLDHHLIHRSLLFLLLVSRRKSSSWSNVPLGVFLVSCRRVRDGWWAKVVSTKRRRSFVRSPRSTNASSIPMLSNSSKQRRRKSVNLFETFAQRRGDVFSGADDGSFDGSTEFPKFVSNEDHSSD